jgi:hypothetical protein
MHRCAYCRGASRGVALGPRGTLSGLSELPNSRGQAGQVRSSQRDPMAERFFDEPQLLLGGGKRRALLTQLLTE